jgi:hypothetical protein
MRRGAMPRAADILRLLQRSDKYYIGGGNRLLWAPPFPLFADQPGYWDEAHYYNFEFRPLFTWTLLDEYGLEIPLRFISRRWDPSAVIQTYAADTRRGGLAIKESRCVLPSDVASSEISINFRGKGKAVVHLVAWTAQENSSAGDANGISDATFQDDVFTFFKHVKPADSPGLKIGTVFGLGGKTRSYALQLSEGTLPPPRWVLSPWYEKFSAGRLPNTLRDSGIDNAGILFMGLHEEILLPPGKPVRSSIGIAVSPSVEESRRGFRTAMKGGTPASFSVPRWNEYFSGVPRFHCSDEHISRYYWYRWYGLRLNTIEGGEGNYPHPAVCEGIGRFRAPVSYSAPGHMLENRWRHDPALAQGSLLTFIANQRSDGGFRGYIDLAHFRPEFFYHANWGSALLHLDAVHHSPPFLRQVHEGLVRYARYFDKERDDEGSGLYDIDNHYETGQEFMHRYTAVNPDADRDNWGEVFRLKGVDATVYIYELKRALAVVTRALGKPGEAELWEIEADKIRNAVRSTMWNPGEEMFFDIDPLTSAQTMVKAATCFYPYFTDIVSAEHLRGLQRHLLNRNEFWPAFPVPSTPLDDATFCAEPEWKGKRMNCPWNGRVWPMTNSHMAEALARSAIAFDDRILRQRTAELIRTFIHMMFFEGDPSRPNCFEHYNPVNGKPSIYRGIDDYQHSWVIDLIIKYVCGIRPTREVLIVDPFPFSLASASIDDVLIRGRRVRVEIDRKKFTVWVEGKEKGTSALGRGVAIPLK